MAKKKDQTQAAAPAAPEVVTQDVIATKVATYFEQNPTVPEVYSTVDGYLFPVKRNAVNHAKTIGEGTEPTVHTNTTLPEAEATEEDKTDTTQ